MSYSLQWQACSGITALSSYAAPRSTAILTFWSLIHRPGAGPSARHDAFVAASPCCGWPAAVYIDTFRATPILVAARVDLLRAADRARRADGQHDRRRGRHRPCHEAAYNRRDLSRRHREHRSRPVGRRQVARHELRPGDAAHHPAAGHCAAWCRPSSTNSPR